MPEEENTQGGGGGITSLASGGPKRDVCGRTDATKKTCMGKEGKEKQVTHTNTRHEQHHNRPPHPKNHPPHLTTIEGGAATVRTTSHTHESKRNRSHTQTHDKNNTINDHTKNHAPLTF